MIKILSIAAAALLATNASAAVIVTSLGPITVPPTQTFSPGVKFTTKGIDSGWYEFTILTPMTLTASSFTNTALSTKGEFDFKSIDLYSGTGIGGSILQTGGVSVRTLGTMTAGLAPYTLKTGSYTIAYTGNAVGTPASVGSSITFAAVPEPAAWMMMVGGFALVGASVRRRSTAVAA